MHTVAANKSVSVLDSYLYSGKCIALVACVRYLDAELLLALVFYIMQPPENNPY